MVEAVAMPDPRRSVLIVVDMQNSFIHERGACAVAGYPVATLAAAVEPCRIAIETARRAGVPIVFTRYTYRADFRDGGFMLREKFPALLEANALVAGSWDQAIVDELSVDPADFIVDKNRPSSFYGTPLDSYLNTIGVEDVVVCGITTNCCVETTVRDAAQRDFRTFVVADATAEWEQDRHDVALKSMGILFAHLISNDALGRAWH